ncbi:MAG TPA: hypothetical protein VFC19_01565 [Candidatus Limnocylindrales bacterium]|nr:hypothetical protein [Candidatus Limnocylindrales bacterium]
MLPPASWRSLPGWPARWIFQAFHFSYIGDKIGVTETYRLLQEKLIDLLNDGAVNFRSVAQALNIAANGYQEEDRNAVHRLKNIW